MSIDRRLRAAVEAVDELWSGAEETAERGRLFLTSLQPHPLPEPVTASIGRLLDGLREEVGASLYCAVYEEGEVRVVAQSSGPNTPPVTEWVDFARSAHAHSFGKCLLAQLDEDALRDHLARHRPARLTSRTLTHERLLVHQLHTPSPWPSPFLDLQEYSMGWVSAAVSIGGGGRIGAVAAYLPLAMAHRLRGVGETLHRLACPPLDLALLGRTDHLPQKPPPLEDRPPVGGDRTLPDLRPPVDRAMAKGS
ncbi:IclR family transcriptional regulator C-terminal domain-containing protein [Streptomyces sp. NPDC048650]|uniref:IclR family transcriptional regulator domain-containing protein n=1 Tax=Streptomyces sp. NPDC048650 TaxID=3365583 RepID=UPI0037207E2D